MILLYHKIYLESPTVFWIDVDNFYRQMREIEHKKIVYLSEYDPKDEDQIVITFDGVYKNVLEYAAPILNKFGYPFELFIVGNYIGEDNSFDTPEPKAFFASEDELKELIRYGGRLEWHSKSHPDFGNIYDEKIIEKELEIEKSIKLLDPKGFKFFAYPHGKFNDKVINIVKKNFIGAVADIDGDDKDKYRLTRKIVTKESTFKKYKISVIIPSYKYGCFLPEAIESVLRQTRPVDEIIIADDASPDNTGEIAEIYQDKFPSLIRYVKNESNLGIVRNFNNAIRLAKGDYVCFLGADNRFRSDYIEKTARVLDKNNDVAIVYTDFALFGVRAKMEYEKFNKQWQGGIKSDYYYIINFPEFNEDTLQLLDRGINFIHGSSMYRKKIAEMVGGYKERENSPEDYNLFYRMIKSGWKAKRVPCPLLEYRQHSFDQANIVLQSYMELKFYKEQVKLLKEEKTKLQNSILRLINVGENLLKQGDNKNAFEIFKIVCEINPKIRINIETQKKPDLNYIPEHIEKKLQEIEKIIDNNELVKAETMLQDIIKEYPNFGKAYNELGGIYYRKGEKEKALNYIKKACENDPSDIFILKNLANLYLELDYIDEALSSFEKVITLNPNDVEALVSLGRISELCGRIDDARVFYETALNYDPTNKDVIILIEGLPHDILKEDTNLSKKMKEDWDKRAKENAKYYVHTTEKEENEEEFDQSGKDNVDNIIMPKLSLITDGKDPKTLRILEIGCGIGRMTKHLAGIFGKVCGIDVSEEMTKRASERLRGVENTFFCVNNGFDLSFFKDSVFDFVFSFIVFQHIPEKEIIFNYIKEVYRILKNKGVFMFQVQGCMDPQWLAIKKDTWHGETVTEEEISLIADELGFTILEKKGQGTQYAWYTMKKRIPVSIIIPVYNNIELTGACVNSILKQEKNSNYEIIIVDNGSTDETNNYFKNLEIEKIRYFRFEENLGFVEGCNFGASHAEGDYIVFLNNDTEIQKGWLDNLLKPFQIRPDCGAVGCKLIYPDGTLQEAGGIIFSDGNGWNYGRGMDSNDPRFNFVREVDYCSGAALMVRKDLWDEIGGFDERYSPAYYEDTDLCFEIRKRGYKVYYQPKSVVVHHEGKTAGQNLTKGFKRFQTVNHQKFIEKRKEELKKQYPNNIRYVTKASMRNVKGRILFIDYFLPMFDRASGSLRLFNILKLMKEMDFHISFLSANDDMKEKYIPILEDMGIEAYTLGYFTKKERLDFDALSNFLKERDFDYAVIEFWSLAKTYIPLIRKVLKTTKLIVDTVDIHFVREIREAEIAKDDNLLKKAMKNKEEEISVYRLADRIWVVTDKDREAIRSYVPGIPIDIIPNVHRKVNVEKKFDRTSDLLFVGNFRHPPNRDAVFYLCHEIFPLIKKELQNVKLFIVGNNPQDDIRALASEDIIVTGYVEDLSPYLLSARVSVSPLRYGAGMKGKIGEALSWGLPVVTTSIGAEGMGLIHERDVLIADTPSDFVREVTRLYNDKQLWERLSRNGRLTIERMLSPEVVEEKLKEALITEYSINNNASNFYSELYIEYPECNFKDDLVSIIIPVVDNWDYTGLCLDSIVRYTDVPYEIVLVDNGSKEPLYPVFLKWKKRNEAIPLTYIRIDRNTGFAGACNRGFEFARGNYIVFLNNDTLVTPGWLKHLLTPLKSDRKIGITGPLSNCINGRQRIMDCPIDLKSPANVDFGRLSAYSIDIAERNAKSYATAEVIIGLCMAMTREFFEGIGGFDERFYPGNFEDNDLSIRAVLKGYLLLVCKNVFIYHFGSKTFNPETVNYYDAYRKNFDRFKEKWCINPDTNEDKTIYEILLRKDYPLERLINERQLENYVLVHPLSGNSIKNILDFYLKNKCQNSPLIIACNGIGLERATNILQKNYTQEELEKKGDITLFEGDLKEILNNVDEENRYLIFSWKDTIEDRFLKGQKIVVL